MVFAWYYFDKYIVWHTQQKKKCNENGWQKVFGIFSRFFEIFPYHPRHVQFSENASNWDCFFPVLIYNNVYCRYLRNFSKTLSAVALVSIHTFRLKPKNKSDLASWTLGFVSFSFRFNSFHCIQTMPARCSNKTI